MQLFLSQSGGIFLDEDLVSGDEQLSIDESKDARGTLLARVYPSVTPDHGSDDDPDEEEVVGEDHHEEAVKEESVADSDGEKPDEDDSTVASTGAETSSADDVFPFLGFDDSERTAPCPYCREGVENTREAFVTHWIESDDCDGPQSSPPASAVGPSLQHWDEIVDEVRSGRVTGYSESATTDESSEEDVEDGGLPIANPDGSNPWLAIHGEGRKVPCPFCEKWVFNSERAFRRHWRKSETCSAAGDPGAETTTSGAVERSPGSSESGSKSTGETPSGAEGSGPTEDKSDAGAATEPRSSDSTTPSTDASSEDPSALAAAARDDSVTKDRLNSTGAEWPTNGYLDDEPAITYFDDEQPHYFFYNETRGIKFGSHSVSSGAIGPYRASMWVTSRGIHFFQGYENRSDYHEFISFEEMNSLSRNQKIAKTEFEITTNDSDIVFYAKSSTGDAKSAEEYVTSQI